MSATTPSAAAPRRSPELIIVVGCLIAVLTFGPRSSVDAFQADMLADNGWTRDIFSFGIALQNLLWGVGQPFAGGVADRFGATRVLAVGAALYGRTGSYDVVWMPSIALGVVSGLLNLPIVEKPATQAAAPA